MTCLSLFLQTPPKPPFRIAPLLFFYQLFEGAADKFFHPRRPTEYRFRFTPAISNFLYDRSSDPKELLNCSYKRYKGK